MIKKHAGSKFTDDRPIYVYFFRDVVSGYVKIGHSRDVEERFVHLQIGNPHPVENLGYVLAGLDEESYFKKKYEADRFRGEWYHPSEDLMEEIFETLGARRVDVPPKDEQRYFNWGETG